MFSPRTAPSSGRRQSHRPSARKSLGGTGCALLFSPRRTHLSAARSTPTRGQSLLGPEPVSYDVQTFGSSLPVKVMEALTTAQPEDQVCVEVDPSGWAWMVCAEKLIIWKISQTAVAKLCVCKELPLPPSSSPFTSALVSLSSPSPLDSSPLQGIRVLAVSVEGEARFWSRLSHEGNYSDSELELGERVHSVESVRGGGFIVCSSQSLLRACVDGGRLQVHSLPQGQSIFSGISRRVSSLFGILSAPTTDTVHSVLWCPSSSSLYSLSSSALNKWNLDDSQENHVYTWDHSRTRETIRDSIWGSDSNFEEMKDRVNVTFLDMKQGLDGLVLLAAAWNPEDTPCLVFFCLLTLSDCGSSVSEEVSVEVTKLTSPYQSEEALRGVRLLVPVAPGSLAPGSLAPGSLAPGSLAPGSLAFIVTPELVFACSTRTERAAVPEEKISFNTPGDRVCGSGSCSGLPVLFSLHSGLVALVKRETSSVLPQDMEESLCSSLTAANEVSVMETRSETVAEEDKTKLLKAAFLQFCRNDHVGAQSLTDQLFPEEGVEPDVTVMTIDLDLVDDYPASDPRWAESVPEESGAVLTSLIILHQLEDKMKAHGFFMDFLQQVGLLERLTSVSVRSSPMATRLLLCEHAEKLQAAMVLKNHQSKHQELMNRAILSALTRRGTMVPPSLTAADVFFREVSQVDSVLECLLEEEERSLKENHEEGCSEEVLIVNNILKDVLQAALMYRETKASMYRGSERGEEPEYIPWTASPAVRSLLTRQHRWLLLEVYPQADSQMRSALCEQLVALLDLHLGGYVSQLSSVRGRPDRFNTLEREYEERRGEMLSSLLELGQYQWVSSLAEKYCDFDVLVQMCEQTDNHQRLQYYMNKFSNQDFADFLFRWYLEKGKRGKLLSQPAAQHGQLTTFLTAHTHLSWLHHIHVQQYQQAQQTLLSQAEAETRYFTKKKTLLALSKLTALASDQREEEVRKTLEDIVEQERFLLHQETLPRQLLEEKQQNMQTMPVLSAHNLIQLYICDDNRRSDEYDFKKALDLLQYTQMEDVDLNVLKCEILGRALRKDDWSVADGNDDPLEAAKDSVFVKILLKLIQEGVALQSFLPDVQSLLDLEDLRALRSKPSFEFVLRANYEHYLQM